MKALFLAAFLLLPLIPLQAAEQKAQPRSACADDIDKLCKGKKGPELETCMKSHEPQISKKCKDEAAANRARYEAHAKEVKQACSKDVEKFCKGPPAEIGNCMRGHAKELSVGCTEALAKRP